MLYLMIRCQGEYQLVLLILYWLKTTKKCIQYYSSVTFCPLQFGAQFVCEEFAFRLQENNWNVITTSNKYNRISRLADMVSTVIKKRNQYEVANVDIYSGPSFIWAEIVCYVLGILHKPYHLVLHGGGLPEFALKNRRRVRGTLNSANAVTTPLRWQKLFVEFLAILI